MAWADFSPDEILARLTARGVDFVVVGGFAAVIHGSPRVTQDLDLCYSPDPENLHALADALTEMNARLYGTQDDLPFPADERHLKGCKFIALQTDLGKLDLLSSSAGASDYSDLKASADRCALGSLLVSVAAIPDLIATKRMAALKHRADIAELETIERLHERRSRWQPTPRRRPSLGRSSPSGAFGLI